MSTFKLKARPTFSFTAEIRNLDGEVLPLQVEARHMRKAALDDFVARRVAEGGALPES